MKRESGPAGSTLQRQTAIDWDSFDVGNVSFAAVNSQSGRNHPAGPLRQDRVDLSAATEWDQSAVKQQQNLVSSNSLLSGRSSVTSPSLTVSSSRSPMRTSQFNDGVDNDDDDLL